MYKESLLERIKEHFDVNNASIAALLGISVDLINSIAIGRRSFDLYHLQPLLKLEKPLPSEGALGLPPEFADDVKAELTAKVAKVRRSLTLQEARLERLERHRTALQKGLHACHVLLQGAGSLSDHEEKWVKLRQRHLTARLGDRSLHEILLLKAKVAGLKAELNVLNSLIEGTRDEV